MFDAVNFGAGRDDHILGGRQPAQAAVRALGSFDRLFSAVWHNDKKIQVAVLCRSAPGMRSEKINRFGGELRPELSDGFIEQPLGDRLHEAGI